MKQLFKNACLGATLLFIGMAGRSSLAGDYEGIGIALGRMNDDLFAILVFPNSPAAKAGVRSGDMIVTIDGSPARGMETEEAVRRMRGPKDTRLPLTVRHRGSASDDTVSIVRESIELPEEIRTQLREEDITRLRTNPASPLSQSALYFALVSSDSVVSPGKEFEVALYALNAAVHAVDDWQTTIEFDVASLEFAGYHLEGAARPDAPGEARMAPGEARMAPIEARLDGGHIVLRPANALEGPLRDGIVATLVFRAQNAPGPATVAFARGREASYALRLGKDVLGDGAKWDDGCVDLQFEIAAAKTAPLPRRAPHPPQARLTSRMAPGASGAQRVYLTLDNPDGVPVTRLKVRLLYNPKEIVALDSDRGNWIRAGDNICDGPYHEAFSFDFHNDNTIHAGEGRIEYDMGAMRNPVRSQGVFVHADFLPRAGTARSIVILEAAEISVGEPASVDGRTGEISANSQLFRGGRDWIIVDFDGAKAPEGTS